MADPDRRTPLLESYENSAVIVSGITAEQVTFRTPCPGYDVAGLIDHMVEAAYRAAALGRGRTPPAGDDSPHVELAHTAAQLRRAAEEAAQAWGDDSRLSSSFTMPWGEEYSGATLVNMYLAELAAHAWDLALATGQLDRLDPSLAVSALDGPRAVIEPEYRDMVATGSPSGRRFRHLLMPTTGNALPPSSDATPGIARPVAQRREKARALHTYPHLYLTFHARAARHPVTEEQTVTRHFCLARAPRPSPDRAKDRRSRPEHDRSPRDRGSVAPPRGSRRHAGAVGPPSPRSASRAQASMRSGETAPSRYAKRASPSSISTVPCCHLTAAWIGRAGPKQGDDILGWMGAPRRDLGGAAWRGRNRRSRGGRGHCARQHPERRALTAAWRARRRPPRSARRLRSRRAPR